MFPSGVGNAYGSQSYASLQAYRQAGAGYTGMPIIAPDSGLPSQHLSGPSTAAHQYGGLYGASYGKSTQNSAEQVAATGVTGMGSLLQGLSGGSYAASLARGQAEQGAFIGKGLLSDPGSTYSNYVGLNQPHQQSGHGDQPSFFRQQLLQAQQLQSGADPRQTLLGSALDGSIRGSDYLAARGAAILHGSQDYGTRDMLGSSYGARIDVNPGIQGAHQLMGTARRNLGDDVYARGSSAAGYGVSLPPGRDYSTGKGLGGTLLDPSYPGSLQARTEPPSVSISRREDHQDDRGTLPSKIEEREESLRRDREHDRERERLLERQERERDHEHGRVRESRRRDSTPRRSARDRRTSFVGGREKPMRRSSPHREASHRRHSPVKEKRREYVCKVNPYCLVEAERDLVSICRRYPKLSVSPEFSKLVLRWPKEELNISLCTAVSFEHDIIEVSIEADPKDAAKNFAEKIIASGVSKFGKTSWNAKVMLMSGVGSDSLAQLVSEQRSDAKISHINNILRFALLREEQAFMAIGGPWNALTDGDDPSVDDFSLIRTAIRCTKEMTQIDLANCQHWHRFLEIHYDRVCKDGFGCYREVTVMFIPDLANCLPPLDAWQNQWISRRQARAEREREMISKKSVHKDKSGEKKDNTKGAIVTDKVKKENSVDSIDPKTDKDAKSSEKVKKRKHAEVNGSKSNDDAKSTGKIKKGKGSAEGKKEKKNKKEGEGLEEPATTIKKKGKKAGKKASNKKTAEKKDKVGTADGNQGDVEVVKKVKKAKVKDDDTKEFKKSEKTEMGEKKGSRKKMAKGKKDKAARKKNDGSEKESQEDKAVKLDTPKSGVEQKEDKVKEKERVDDGNAADSLGITVKEKKEKGKSEGLPQYSGLLLQTKRSKNAKLRSMSLSLDGLLDYNEKDRDESTFELSLFAEAFYEMLQYKMGCRILPFLEKLWQTYSTKREQKKRDRVENPGKENEKEVGSPRKRSKHSDMPKVEGESVKCELEDADESKPEEVIPKLECVESKQDTPEVEKEMEEIEDPEEELVDENDQKDEVNDDNDTEEEEAEDEPNKAVPDAAPQEDSAQEEKSEDEKADAEEKPEASGKDEKSAKKLAAGDELLQAFRFFDREWLGYIKVEDMRTIIYNLGMFHSKRAVKELLRVAAWTSSKVQDNRIYYKNLLRKTDLL